MTKQDSENLTPMMRQYLRMKQVHKEAILFFRMGDFYEMFNEDARTAARVLGLTLTSRDKSGNATPMAGVPHHAADSYIKRLVDAGFKVAICDQVEDPALAKGLVKRDVTRLITPGTVTEDSILSASEHNYLAAVYPRDNAVGLAWVDMSTGAFMAEDVPNGQLADELARIAPAECIVPEEGIEGRAVSILDGMLRGSVTRRPAWAFGRDTAMRCLLEHFGVASLKGFGCDGLGPAISAAGAIIQYLLDTQKIDLKHIRTLSRFQISHRLVIDRASQISLELTRAGRDAAREGSLLKVLDRTRTPMGGRLLKEWLLAPLIDIDSIRARQDTIEALAADHRLRDNVRRALDGIYDIERLAVRVSCGRANARDLLGLKSSLSAMPRLKEALSASDSQTLRDLAGSIDLVEEARILISAAIAPDPPVTLTEGGVIRDGYNSELDELRSIRTRGRDWIAAFQAREVERTGIPSLKVGYNKVFGYYIEVTNVHSEKIPPEYVRKQTLKNAERYITPQLKDYETRVLTADDRAKELEYSLFQEVRAGTAEFTARFQDLAAVVAEIDSLASLADIAVEYDYVRPEITEGVELEIRDGRHPVLERTISEEFVPNDLSMNPDDSLMLVITGPNMAGKSTYIRQVALIVIMAQMGSFVPASSARIGVADRIFTRVGASDELSQGMSTFMVEMVETANILNNATRRSLIVLDEVGRGTSTFDGVSIAWAVAEYIHERLMSRTLFATHYHELTELGSIYPRIKNCNVAVREWGGEIIFLRKIIDGGADKSYGLHVGRLAGLPHEVVERAKVILHNLETQTLDAEDKPRLARGTGGPKKKPQKVQIQLNMFAQDDVLRDELRRLDLNNLTPVQALARLEELKRQAEKGG